MALLFRLSFVWIILGLVLGAVLRVQFRGRALLPFMLSFVPWLVHVVYVVLYTQRNAVSLQSQLLMFVGVSTFLALGVFWAGFRSVQRGGNSVVYLPALLALFYALPLFWYSSVLRTENIGMDSIPVIMFVGGIMFVVSMMIAFRVGASGIRALRNNAEE